MFEKKRILGVAALAVLNVLVSCSDDEGSSSQSTAGSAGQIGVSGNGGFAGIVGVGGSVSGSGGTAGSAVGGNAGSAGAAAGSGGLGGDATGGSAGSAGTGADGGSSGLGGSAGSGGTLGEGGGDASGGTSGSVGAGGFGGDGQGGEGGESGAGGEDGAGESCTGCARLSVPLTAEQQSTNYVITIPVTDLTDALVRARVFVHSGTGGAVQLYLQTGAPDFVSNFHEWRFLSGMSGWTEIEWDLFSDETPENFPYDQVTTIGIQITSADSSSWTNPTVVYVDSIVVDDGLDDLIVPLTFDSAESVTSAEIPPASPPAERVMWLNGYDSSVPGSTLTWLGP